MARRYRPAHAASPFRRSTAQRLVLAIGTVAVLVLVAAAGAVWSVNHKLGLIPRLDEDTELDEIVTGEPLNYLIVGSDSREGLDPNAVDAAAYLGGNDDTSGRRADVIMVVRVDPEGQRLDVLSLPRDLWIPIAGTGGEERINSAYSHGPQQLIDTVRQEFGIEIHHYVEIDFAGFKGIVDTVGGVPMYFDKPMRDQQSGLSIDETGCVTLDGVQALALARARHLQYYEDGRWRDDVTSDLGRIARQQLFLRRMFDRVASTVDFTDLLALNRLADVAIQHVTIDRDLEITLAINVARQYGGFPSEAIGSYSLSVERFFTDGGADVLRYDRVAAQPILNVFRDEPVTTLPTEGVAVQVSNGSGQPHQATDTAEALTELGFATEILADSPDQAETTVRYGGGGAAAAGIVARHVAGRVVVQEDPGLPEGVVVLTTGASFEGVLDIARAEDDPGLVLPVGVAGAADDTATTGGSSADGTADDAGATTTSAAPVSTSTTLGVVPGEPPAGVTCEA
jgi:LCP family protein required for cell wall assembly